MVTFSKDMIHDFFAALRRHPESSDLSDRSRELDRRRRSLADGARTPHHDPLKARARHASFAAASADPIGQMVWECAARARKLGGTVALVRDGDEGALDRRPSQAVVTAWLAGLALWAIVLFLLSVE